MAVTVKLVKRRLAHMSSDVGCWRTRGKRAIYNLLPKNKCLSKWAVSRGYGKVSKRQVDLESVNCIVLHDNTCSDASIPQTPGNKFLGLNIFLINSFWLKLSLRSTTPNTYDVVPFSWVAVWLRGVTASLDPVSYSTYAPGSATHNWENCFAWRFNISQSYLSSSTSIFSMNYEWAIKAREILLRVKVLLILTQSHFIMTDINHTLSFYWILLIYPIDHW